MDPRRLLVFREVARTGSLAGAARRLGWTQPAVSQHVRHLERELGVPLVVREGRGSAPTEAGRLLLRHADTVAGALAAARADVAALTELRAGTVRLAAFPCASATLVPRALALLERAHPGVDVRLVEAEPPEATELVTGPDTGGCDLAVTFRHDTYGGVRPAGVDTVPLLDEELALLVAADGPYGDRDDLPLDLLAGERWIAGCERCRAHLLAVCAAAGFTPHIRHSTDDYLVTQRLVAAGAGVTLAPRLTLAAVRVPGVAVLAAPAAGLRHVDVLVRRQAARSAAAGAVTAALRQAAAEVAPALVT